MNVTKTEDEPALAKLQQKPADMPQNHAAVSKIAAKTGMSAVQDILP